MKVMLGKPSPPTDFYSSKSIRIHPASVDYQVCGSRGAEERLAFSSLSASLTPSGFTRPD